MSSAMTKITAPQLGQQRTELSNEMHNEPSDEQNNSQGNEPICVHDAEIVTRTHQKQNIEQWSPWWAVYERVNSIPC